MRFKIDSVLPTPSKELIQKFEEFYEVVLPEEYKLFLQQYNGGIPEANIFAHGNNEYIVERFLCLLEEPNEYEDEGWYEIRVVMSQLDSRIVEDTDEDSTTWPIVPVAALFAGNYVCLDFRNSLNPSVVIWFHEESDDFQPVTDKVAENFSDFINMLTN